MTAAPPGEGGSTGGGLSGEVRGERRDRLRRTEIDGVATVWCPVPGPLRAALTVRVGSADETLVTSGISHLLEHLALFGLGRPGDHSNGFVDQTQSVFTVEGDEAEVRDFLGDLTRHLVDPPVHRLDDERAVLGAEEAGRAPSPLDAQLIWRYGASGYGLAGLDQLGVRRVGPTDVIEWSHRYVTRANSVLWISGPPPAGLRLHLPDGAARPAPDPRRTLLPGGPAWFTGPAGRITLDAVVTRGWPATALADVLRGRMIDELRLGRAVAYSPEAGYSRLTRDAARLVAGTDLVAERQGEGVGPMLALLEHLSSGSGDGDGVRPEEIDAWVARNRRRALDPQHGLGILHGAAWDLLQGDEPRDARSWLEEMALVTPGEVAAVAREARASLLAQIPVGPATGSTGSLDSVAAIAPVAPGPGWVQAPRSREPRLTGREHRSRTPGSPARLILGPDGISLVSGEDHLSVRPGATAAVLRWNDGRRVLVSDDGNQIVVEPTLWAGGPGLVEEVDRLWSPALVVEMGSRPDRAIPRPAPVRRIRGLRWRSPGWTRFGRWLPGTRSRSGARVDDEAGVA
jgi:zinc protease